ncbi:hypothetical protein [Sulfitobacter sp. PS-8MA]|uniref:DUF6902 family protein n=1 Tax=Sulfitobacter sp. PS-8MA TaxID=3237707 RepID=UPI0034C6774E
MTNVVRLRPADERDDSSHARLIEAVATRRRPLGDVFWLKENAELLGALASLGAELDTAALAPLVGFHADACATLRDYPQYYRFILSIALDLEDLGLPQTQAAKLCAQVDRAGLLQAELSDLQRAEARRLLRRRGVGPRVDQGALGMRLRRFIGRSGTFALPNRKAAYELTHIVYYLSDYGRQAPDLPAAALVSLEYTGLLAFLDQDMDLLAEVCAALRFAKATPSPLWEAAVAKAHGACLIEAGGDASQDDDFHEWLVTGWATRIAGRALPQQRVPTGALRFHRNPGAGGALRSLAVCLRDMGNARSADWGRMRAEVLPYLGADSHAVLAAAERSSPRFGEFFEGFARVTVQ